MRIRSVSPDLCVSETMARLPAELERTFVRLWTHCDDEGRCVDNPRLIKAAIYPLHDDVTAAVVDRQLYDLEDAGLIVRYEVDGKHYLVVRSWGEYQHPQKARPSQIPAPPERSRTPTRRVREGYGPGEGEGEGEGDKRDTSTSSTALEVIPAVELDVVAVFDAWRQATGHDRARLDPKRKRLIKSRLQEGYAPEDLIAAVQGVTRSPFHMGDNDQHTRYDGLELILRDGAHVEKFMHMTPPEPSVSRGWRNIQALEEL